MVLSPFLQKLLFVNQFEISNGKVSILGSRNVLLHASAILELQELDETKLYDLAKKSSFKNMGSFVNHARVYGKMKSAVLKELAALGKKIGESDEGALRTVEHLFNIYGLGQLTIRDVDNKEFHALLTLKDSSIALEWMEKFKGRSNNAVCTLTAGVLAGMFSYLFGKEVDCVESGCKAQGKAGCSFEIAS